MAIPFLVAFFATFSMAANAALPTTDIAIFKLDELKAKPQPYHLTYRTGYDNQPKFTADGEGIYFTRGFAKADGKEQTDIMLYSFVDKSLTNISKSPDSSEYSATPYQDSVVSIIGVADCDGKQYLNRLELKGGLQTSFSKVLEPIGYHAWLNDKEAAVFVLGDVMSLQVLDLDANKQPKILADKIGRCLQRMVENKVSFTAEHKARHTIFWLDESRKIHDTGITLPVGVQDYVWLNDKEVIFGQGSKLYKKSSKTMTEIADLANFDIKGISRLAIDKNNKRLAVVYNR